MARRATRARRSASSNPSSEESSSGVIVDGLSGGSRSTRIQQTRTPSEREQQDVLHTRLTKAEQKVKNLQDRTRYSEKLLEGILELLPEKDLKAVMRKVKPEMTQGESMDLDEDTNSVSSSMDVGAPPLNVQLSDLSNLASRLLAHNTSKPIGQNRSARRQPRHNRG